MHHAIDRTLLEVCEPNTEVGIDQVVAVHAWLDEFESDASRRPAMDHRYALWNDYSVYDPQNRAQRILLDFWDRCLFVEVPAGAVGPLVPQDWQHLDNHRRWLLLVALARPATIEVVNATHPAWAPSQLPVASPPPIVSQVLQSWIQVAWPASVEVVGDYKPAPATLSGGLAHTIPAGKGTNHRQAWEDSKHRYEWDSQHGTVEVYLISSGVWQHEATPDGIVMKTTYSGPTRHWGR